MTTFNAKECRIVSLVAQLCPTLCNPMNCSTPGLPVHHQLPVYPNWCPLIRWCHPTISSSVVPFSACPQSFPASGSFPVNRLYASGGQRIAVSASASILAMNIQDWFPLGLTGLISVLSKGLKTLLQHHSSSALSFLYSPALTSIRDYWENHSFD